MTDRALIDTGALLAIVNPRDQYHERAVALGRGFLSRGGRWIGTTLVLGEFHGYLIRRLDPRSASSLLASLVDDPAYEWLDASAELVREAVPRWLERFADQPFTLTDVVSFEVMRRLGLRTAFAFDRHFEVAGFQRLE